MLLLPQGAQSPTTITLRFQSPIFGPDLTQVSAVTAGLLRRDSTSATLTFTIVAATTRELVAQFTFTGTELTVTGAYYLAPQLTVNGGPVASETVPLFVGGPFNAIPALEQDAWVMATVPVPSLGPLRDAWSSQAGNFTASPFSPNVALDLRTTAISASLWSARNGDIASFSDVYNGAVTHNFTLTAASGHKVPVQDGTYATSHAYATAGFVLRLRFRASDGLWIPA